MPGFDPIETRVIGCLLEKQRTTPDGYPLSLNALLTACNQSTNRDPVTDYDEAAVRQALGSLGKQRWVRSATGHGGRAIKYRHLAPDRLGLPEPQLSLLAILMLRGPQTPGELKQRVERLCSFPDLAAVQMTLEEMVEAELVARLPRRPGQKEERFEQTLGADEAGVSADEAQGGVVPAEPVVDTVAVEQASPGSGPDVARLEQVVRELTRRVETLERQAERGTSR